MTEGKIKNKNLYVNMNEFNNKDINSLIKILESPNGRFKFKKIKLILVEGGQCGCLKKYLELNDKNINIIKSIIKPYVFPSMKFKFMV
jgi:hypothetical protein